MARIAFSENEERFIRRQVEAGNYADEGDVVSAGLRILQELEDAREKWLLEEIPARFEELRADPQSGVSLGTAFADLDARHHSGLAQKK
ncbi:type II toxin-antitoxin system ParD family antitoxin [Neorhizobium sp. NCHU2750]|uniref:ribbon-helix-helix domain-containing protein n=1 Tax=Neorhizobium sp. NCHU2750 TaxID=1825976 RepID=UPI000E769F7F|nr:CopG family transcriptional regulator [Neorhizobium sp. NCHU2750]